MFSSAKPVTKMDWARSIAPLSFSLIEFISFVIIIALRGDHDCSNKTGYYGQMIGWCTLAGLVCYIIVILVNVIESDSLKAIGCIMGVIQMAVGITLFVIFIIIQVHLYKGDNDCVDGWKAMYIWSLVYVILVYVSIFLVLLICIIVCCIYGAVALSDPTRK